MQIKVGYDIGYGCVHPTPMLIMLSIHPSRQNDIVGKEEIWCTPATPMTFYSDMFGHIVGSLVAPAGGVTISGRALVNDSGLPDAVAPNAPRLPVEQLPDECLHYLMGSRY